MNIINIQSVPENWQTKHWHKARFIHRQKHSHSTTVHHLAVCLTHKFTSLHVYSFSAAIAHCYVYNISYLFKYFAQRFMFLGCVIFVLSLHLFLSLHHQSPSFYLSVSPFIFLSDSIFYLPYLLPAILTMVNFLTIWYSNVSIWFIIRSMPM